LSIAFNWGTLPKAFPDDKEDIKQELEQYLFRNEGSFVSKLKSAKKQTRKNNQEGEFIGEIQSILDSVLSSNSYDFLSESEGFARSLGKTDKDKEKNKKMIKRTSLKSLVTDTDVKNKIIGFTFMKFGRDLEEIPDFDYLKTFKDYGIETEFVLRPSFNSKTGEPTGKYSYSSGKNTQLKNANTIIYYPSVSPERQAETKANIIKAKGVKSARYITKGHSKFKAAEAVFSFPFELDSFAELILETTVNPESVARLKTSEEFEKKVEEWMKTNMKKLLKPLDGDLKSLQTVKSLEIECKLVTTERKGKKQAASHSLGELNEKFKNASLNCVYYIIGHGYFDFSPYNVGVESSGVNVIMQKHINGLEKRLKMLRRQGVTTGV
tara:strand:- start:1171 stop:2310 length:1140 start_codon:yes stop_codon:yes gene_type:complete